MKELTFPDISGGNHVFAIELDHNSGPLWVCTTMIFGMRKDQNTLIAEPVWRKFYEEQIAAVFKKGSTFFCAEGGWFSQKLGESIFEPNRVLVVYHPDNAGYRIAIQALALCWKLEQKQEAVVIASYPVQILF